MISFFKEKGHKVRFAEDALTALDILKNYYRKENGDTFCAALPESLIESELFGHEKGAFTGALSTKKGLIEMADGGTLFLDEIGEIPLHLQSKLLGVLDDKTFRRVGGQSLLRVNVRIVTATNIDLEEAVRQQKFREYLYYRLSVLRIHVPPLRKRKNDIAPLFFTSTWWTLFR